MATAVLDETDVLLSNKAILGEKKDSPETENVFEWIANRYRSLGYNAEFIDEDPDELDFSKYLSKESLKWLDTIVLDDK